MEQIIEKLKKTVTKDSFTDDEIDLVVQVDYSWDIARAILSSPTPADNLDVVIDLHYHYGFDWGYPKDLIDYFKGVEVLEGNIPQKQALLQLLYNGLYLTKHETLDKNQALCLAHNYFPKEEQNKLTLYLNNYV